MKVLHIVSEMELGGIENLVFSILRYDVQNVYILAISGSREQALTNWPALAPYSDNIIFANKGTGVRFKVVQAIKQACQQLAISVIHTHHIGPLIYGSLASQTMRSVKHIHTQHDIWHLKNLKQWLIEYLILNLRKDIHLIAVSKVIFEYMQRLCPRTPIDLVHNGIDTNRFKPGHKDHARAVLKLPLDATIITNVARLEEVKGQQYLIKALSYLPKSYYLAIAGRGSLLERLQKQSEELGLSNRIAFLGQINDTELVYQAGDLFCLSSLEEGLPLAILEAQACNIPVLCTNIGSCAEGIDPESGRLIAPRDAKAIAEACLQSIQPAADPRDFILAHFSLSALLKKYQQIYALPD